MRISHVELANWKNFKHVSVDLSDRVFLVGPNASGKSNFLDVFRFLRDIAPPGGLEKACGDRDGVSKIRCLAGRSEPGVSVAVTLSEGETTRWRYELAFTQTSNIPSLIREVVSKDDTVILKRPDHKDRKDSLRLSQTALQQISENQGFREVAQFFKSISYLHLVPQIIRNPNSLSENGGTLDAYGNHFLERVAKTPERARNIRLKKILHALTIAVPQLKKLTLANDVRGVPHLVGVYEHWRPRGAKQNEDQFSDGTLRLLGLLWALQEGEGPLLLEEPELSLHSGVVKRLVRLIYRMQQACPRQVLISTHSADLLSDPGIGGEELLMLKPAVEGTLVKLAASVREIRALLESGMSAADAVIPHTEPHQLSLLDQFNP